MDNSEIGVMGEALVLTELVKNGYEVYIPFGGKTKYDLLAHKDDRIVRVQVKSTTVKAKTGKYVVQLKKVRSNKTKNIIYNFDSSESDLLAIVVVPENRVVILESLKIITKTALYID